LARHKFAVLSLTIVALVSSFWFLLDVLGVATQRAPAFRVADFEKRFATFPKTDAHMLYGYISDSQPNDPSALAEFHLTQYVLAPAIITPSASRGLVIVNYHSKQLNYKLLRDYHLQPYRDFGNGVALCRPARR
jgi:hypothetical protein